MQHDNNQPVEPQALVNDAELFRFLLELGIDSRTDDYLRQLARLAAHAGNIDDMSQQLHAQVKHQQHWLTEQLQQRDHTMTEQFKQYEQQLTAQSEQLQQQGEQIAQCNQRDDQQVPPDIRCVRALGTVFRHPLKDGGQGPEMVLIPPGRFYMGGAKDESGRLDSELPQHYVTIAKPFAIGCCTITFIEYDAFCTQTERDLPDDNGWGRDQRPVINVSWNDAQDYCAWMSEQTGQRYRLPSEAEWEYAARAGGTTAFWWSDQINTNLANYDGSSYATSPAGENRQRTLPVKSFQPNPFGLYQVHGNVWEWCQDRWHDNYQGAPIDGSVWESSGSEKRVRRGGCRWNNPMYCRSAQRGCDTSNNIATGVGFRVCCDLD